MNFNSWGASIAASYNKNKWVSDHYVEIMWIVYVYKCKEFTRETAIIIIRFSNT